MATPKGRPAGAQYLTRFVEEMKSTGFVADALGRHGIEGALVAPAARRSFGDVASACEGATDSFRWLLRQPPLDRQPLRHILCDERRCHVENRLALKRGGHVVLGIAQMGQHR